MLIRSLSLAPVIAGLLGSAALIALPGASRPARPVAPAAACTTAWSTPRPIMIGPGYVHIDTPQIVATRAGVALFGDNAFAAKPTDSGFVAVAGWPRGAGMIAGVLLGRSGDVVPIPIPPGVRAFIGVRAASDGAVAHVFWAGSADTSSMQFLHVNSLWYARFDGVRWTTPELVLADSTFSWTLQRTAIAVAGGRAHVATQIRRRASLLEDLLHVMRATNGPGFVTRPGFQAMYADLAAAPDGRLWLATITGGEGDRTRVVVRRGNRGGEPAWGDSVVLYRHARTAAYDPRIVVTPNGTLYVAWIVEPPGRVSGGADRIEVAVSTDHGATWRRLPPITAEPTVRDVHASADGPGGVQLTFHTDSAEGLVVVTRGDGAGWGPRTTFGPTWFAAVLAAPTSDTLYLAWLEWRDGGPERMPGLMLSRRRSCLS